MNLVSIYMKLCLIPILRLPNFSRAGRLNVFLPTDLWPQTWGTLSQGHIYVTYHNIMISGQFFGTISIYQILNIFSEGIEEKIIPKYIFSGVRHVTFKWMQKLCTWYAMMFQFDFTACLCPLAGWSKEDDSICDIIHNKSQIFIHSQRIWRTIRLESLTNFQCLFSELGYHLSLSRTLMVRLDFVKGIVIFVTLCDFKI